jgi:transposase, IS5 family
VRRKAHPAVAQQRPFYERLIQIAAPSVQQARTVRQALAAGGDPPDQPASREATPPAAAVQGADARNTAERLRPELDRFLPLVAQVIHQARARVLEETPVPAQEKLVSLFRPHTRILRRHQTGTPVEFGRQVALDEVEGGIVTR